MLKFFIWLGRIEAASLLLLFFAAMPAKYIFGEPAAVRVVGSLHGALFVAYVVVACWMAMKQRWSTVKTLSCLILSCLPFGTFYFEKKIPLKALIYRRT